ncbi:hypothetical protein DdX_02241 [Ditylenchus destructor]|uniref:Uncharacterized protein n=1 Tax=Ditylenchus destructor TaxID=166010 RepID=A0AAD4NDT8_9BILA|nr:hypothetical protein DdX_02241 [Ditylenchus destructor]
MFNHKSIYRRPRSRPTPFKFSPKLAKLFYAILWLNPPNVRIRRDMVQSELELLRQCRAECREKNEKANEMRFYVQDLEIKETASPKPLRRFPRA